LARTFLLLVLTGVLVTSAWTRLEDPSVSWNEIAPMAALALLPVLAVALGRSRLVIAAVLGLTTLLAASVAFEIPLSEARPRDPQRDFFGPVLDGIQQGFLDFYETQLPFNRLDFPLMHAMVLLAIFGFTALVGMFVAAQRPVAAGLVLVAGLGWPATLMPGSSPIRTGALALAGVLAVLFLLRRERPARGLAQAAAVGVVLVAVAAAASTSEAVAKSAFLSWRNWDPYDRPEDPVSVSYVWNSHYLGIEFPKKRTTVMRVKVSGARRSLYWRATTLDSYSGQGWNEELALSPAEQQEEIDAVERDPLLPPAARNEKNWVRQDVTVEALRDNHLVASAQPVRWQTGTDAPVQHAEGGVVVLPRALRQDHRYTVWSYVPQARPSQLQKVQGRYPAALERYLEIVPTIGLPEWATEGRSTEMAVFFGATHDEDFLISSHQPLYEIASQVTREARSPYEAVVLLEAWFRRDGGFRYDEQPPQAAAGLPALVGFVTEFKRGYCQHYAGAMAVMLRLLGIPARVAAGFTSGTWDADKKEWNVTDHNAHTWVEAYFPGHGWVPFDPTPGRGQLFAPYSAISSAFNARDAAEAAGLDRLGAISPAVLEAIEARRGLPPGVEDQGLGAQGRSGGGAAVVVRDKGPSIVLLALAVLGGAYLAVVLLKAALRSLRFAARDPRVLAGAYRRDLVGFLADQGVELPRSATLSEIGDTLDRYYAVDAENAVHDLTRARFGPPAEAREALHRARRELRAVRKGLRRSLGVFSRLRGAASLRSLSA
jgi:transglutaminase-like putative cysteine protease